MTEFDAINKFFHFSMNFPANFIEECWADDPSLANHFKGKFNHCYEVFGPSGVMSAFYEELSTSNRRKLVEWVMNNFSD